MKLNKGDSNLLVFCYFWQLDQSWLINNTKKLLDYLYRKEFLTGHASLLESWFRGAVAKWQWFTTHHPSPPPLFNLNFFLNIFFILYYQKNTIADKDIILKNILRYPMLPKIEFLLYFTYLVPVLSVKKNGGKISKKRLLCDLSGS